MHMTGQLAQLSQRARRPQAVCRTLLHAALLAAPQPSCLTPMHALFLQTCISAKMYTLGAAFLRDHEVLEVRPIESSSNPRPSPSYMYKPLSSLSSNPVSSLTTRTPVAHRCDPLPTHPTATPDRSPADRRHGAGLPVLLPLRRPLPRGRARLCSRARLLHTGASLSSPI